MVWKLGLWTLSHQACSFWISDGFDFVLVALGLGLGLGLGLEFIKFWF